MFGKTCHFVERLSGLEPEITAWEAAVLPLHHSRNGLHYIYPANGVQCEVVHYVMI